MVNHISAGAYPVRRKKPCHKIGLGSDLIQAEKSNKNSELSSGKIHTNIHMGTNQKKPRSLAIAMASPSPSGSN